MKLTIEINTALRDLRATIKGELLLAEQGLREASDANDCESTEAYNALYREIEGAWHKADAEFKAFRKALAKARYEAGLNGDYKTLTALSF